jgi:hypothetical protein
MYMYIGVTFDQWQEWNKHIRKEHCQREKETDPDGKDLQQPVRCRQLDTKETLCWDTKVMIQGCLHQRVEIGAQNG